MDLQTHKKKIKNDLQLPNLKTKIFKKKTD